MLELVAKLSKFFAALLIIFKVLTKIKLLQICIKQNFRFLSKIILAV